MKIGIDARNLVRPFNGIGRYLVEMANCLSDAGHDLFFYMPEPPAQQIDKLPGTLRLHSHKPASDLRRHIWGQTSLTGQIARDNLDVFWGPAHRLPVRRPADLAMVVTIHDLVWHYHGDTMRRSGRLADKILMPLATKTADVVVADSIATATSLQEVLGVREDKIKVIYPGTTQANHPVATGASPRIDGDFMLFVGTLEPRKNLERLLQAFSRLSPAERAACRLVIVGGKGWRHKNLDEIVGALGLSESVDVLGFVSEEALVELYAGCRFVVFPSLYEGFGFPIVEANRHGKPVLTSSTSSMVEVAGTAGLLVDPFDVDAIAEGLRSMVFDNNLYQKLASAAPANALRFDWPSSAAALLETFEEAINRRRMRNA